MRSGWDWSPILDRKHAKSLLGKCKYLCPQVHGNGLGSQHDFRGRAGPKISQCQGLQFPAPAAALRLGRIWTAL